MFPRLKSSRYLDGLRLFISTIQTYSSVNRVDYFKKGVSRTYYT